MSFNRSSAPVFRPPTFRISAMASFLPGHQPFRANSSSPRIRFVRTSARGSRGSGARPWRFHPDPRSYLPTARGLRLYPFLTATMD